MGVRPNFIWARIGQGKSPVMGNAKCGDCKQYFKFIVSYYWQEQFTKCSFCGNTNNNAIVVLDLNGNSFSEKQLDAIERSNELIKEYAEKYRSTPDPSSEFPHIKP